MRAAGFVDVRHDSRARRLHGDSRGAEGASLTQRLSSNFEVTDSAAVRLTVPWTSPICANAFFARSTTARKDAASTPDRRRRGRPRLRTVSRDHRGAAAAPGAGGAAGRAASRSRCTRRPAVRGSRRTTRAADVSRVRAGRDRRAAAGHRPRQPRARPPGRRRRGTADRHRQSRSPISPKTTSRSFW